MRYLFDTNILLLYLRQHTLVQHIDQVYNPFAASNEKIVSAVTIGELKAIAKMNNWGIPKITAMELFFNQFVVVGIDSADILERYAEIDAFSQGKLDRVKPTFSARNMGKNDLWIAATASILGATLLTTDQDFEHLDPTFLRLERIKI